MSLHTLGHGPGAGADRGPTPLGRDPASTIIHAWSAVGDVRIPMARQARERADLRGFDLVILREVFAVPPPASLVRRLHLWGERSEFIASIDARLTVIAEKELNVLALLQLLAREVDTCLRARATQRCEHQNEPGCQKGAQPHVPGSTGPSDGLAREVRVLPIAPAHSTVASLRSQARSGSRHDGGES